jgi:hypothetical protein
VHASFSIALGTPRASVRSMTNLLGCMGKFRCAVTMVGDAFQERCGQSREVHTEAERDPAAYGGAVQGVYNPEREREQPR